jgi:hypothetical protein
MRYSPGGLFLDSLFFPIRVQGPQVVDKYGLCQGPQPKGYAQALIWGFVPVDGRQGIIDIFKISAV